LRAQNRIDHRADRAFPVCAGDVNDAELSISRAERLEQTQAIFKAELDSKTLETVEPGERLAVVHDTTAK
jgi:hypothetical protein